MIKLFHVKSINLTPNAIWNYEGLPGVLGNKGTWPFTFGEQGNIAIYFQGTREHCYNFRELGNMSLEKIKLKYEGK